MPTNSLLRYGSGGDRIEDDYRDLYQAWKKDPSPQTTGPLLKQLDPAINRGIKAYVGPDASPTVKSHAKRLTLKALKTYDPKRTRLATHVTNHLQGLRRVARKQQQIMRVPERVALDRQYVYKAEQELEERLGRSPSLTELADHTKLSPQRIQYIRQFTPGISEGMASQPLSEEDAGALPAVQHAATTHIEEAVYHDLDPINQQIMAWSLGLFGEPVRPNQEIAAKLKLSPGAVSQRKAKIQQMLDMAYNYLE